MDTPQVDAYLRRLGAEYPAWPTLDALRELHLRHLRTVPFENLSVHLGEEIVLQEERLLDKVVGARRGGFCYELNGLFGALLTALGYEVTLLAARVYGEGGALGFRTTIWRCSCGRWTGRLAGGRRVRGAQPRSAGVRGAG